MGATKVNEKKKAQRLAKREKEKEEKERFLNLSDREKRALAAERRLLGSGTAGERRKGKVPELVRQGEASPGCRKKTAWQWDSWSTEAAVFQLCSGHHGQNTF